MRDISSLKMVISGELVDRIQIKRIDWWRDENARHKFVKGGDRW
jgi:hypothetical protein